MLIENLQKDIIIKQIKKKIEENKFLSFEKHLSKEYLERLNLIGGSQREDSTFVAVAINALYSENTEVIKKKGLSRSKTKGNSEITPEKRKILEELFAKRMSYLVNVDINRQNNLPKLIRNAIDNAKKK